MLSLRVLLLHLGNGAVIDFQHPTGTGDNGTGRQDILPLAVVVQELAGQGVDLHAVDIGTDEPHALVQIPGVDIARFRVLQIQQLEERVIRQHGVGNVGSHNDDVDVSAAVIGQVIHGLHVVVDLRAALIPGGGGGEGVGEAVVSNHGRHAVAAFVGVLEQAQLTGQQHLANHVLTAALNGFAHFNLVFDQHLALAFLGRHGSQNLLTEGAAYQVAVLDDAFRGDGGKADFPGGVAVAGHHDAASAGMNNGSHPLRALTEIVNGLVVFHGGVFMGENVIQESVDPGLKLDRSELCPSAIDIHIFCFSFQNGMKKAPHSSCDA